VQDNSDAVAASGTVTISSGAGSIAAVVNGLSTAVTWGTSDTATAAALAAAVVANPNALVNQHVTATSNLGVVTITAKNPGVTGSAITLAATGTGATASGARLTGGTDATGSSTNTLTMGG
jgi:phage tail sheath gpL-like